MSLYPPMRFALIVCLLAGMSQQMIKTNNYPAARKSDQTDDYHGTKIADPYRWLEDLDSEETRTWVEAENKLSFAYVMNRMEQEVLPNEKSLRLVDAIYG